MSAPWTAGLAALEAELRGLLSSLESDPLPREQALEASGRRVARALASLRDLPATHGRPGGEPLERCLRLHALATELLARRRDELAGQREACSELRGRLRSMRARSGSGDSCDVRA